MMAMRVTPLAGQLNTLCARLGARNGAGTRWTSRGPGDPQRQGWHAKKRGCNGALAPFFCFQCAGTHAVWAGLDLPCLYMRV